MSKFGCISLFPMIKFSEFKYISIKDKAEPITKVPPKRTQYWTATSDAKPKLAISYPVAITTVKAGENIICVDQASAFAVAKWFPNSFYEGPHNGGTEGYYPHYHTGKHGPPHIWFYP